MILRKKKPFNYIYKIIYNNTNNNNKSIFNMLTFISD